MMNCRDYGGADTTVVLVTGGWLGHGNLDTIGDDETPAEAGDVFYQ